MHNPQGRVQKTHKKFEIDIYFLMISGNISSQRCYYKSIY